jgi:hypothetical protein
MKEENLKNYKWLAVPDFSLVPIDMIKVADGEKYISRMLYKYSDKILQDKSNSLMLLVNAGKVYGFIFATINPFKDSLEIKLFHISNELDDKIFERTKNEFLELLEKKKYSSVSWLTKNHELAEKLGFEITEQVVMELAHKEE